MAAAPLRRGARHIQYNHGLAHFLLKVLSATKIGAGLLIAQIWSVVFAIQLSSGRISIVLIIKVPGLRYCDILVTVIALK